MTKERSKSEFSASDGAVDLGGIRLWAICSFVLLLAVMSALGVVYSSYKSRQLFSEVEQQYAKTLQLEEQWGRLLLEQSTWASHARIEQLAKSKLSMVVPDPATIIVVKE